METCWTRQDRETVLAETAHGLWRYVARHAGAMPVVERLLADLTGMPVEALDTLCHLHLVLSDEVTQFVEAALPCLLARLRPVAPRDAATSRAAVRGSITWHATVAARSRAGGADRALYVTSVPRQRWRTPDVRLLLHTLSLLARSCAALRVATSATAGAGRGWTAQLDRVESTVTVALAHRALRDVDVAGIPARVDLAACRRSPREAVRLLARAYARCRELADGPASGALLRALQERVLVPLDDDALYEVWALLGAATVFEQAGWRLRTAGLAGRDALPFAYVSPDGRCRACLRFGHAPAHWRGASRYRTLFEHYGLSGAVRRPDLIVELRRGRRRRHILVEVKRTRDPGYIADSIYKVFGYLADFDAVFADQDGARALLLLWSGLEPGAGIPHPPHPHHLVLADHDSYQATLGRLVDACVTP